jgi:ubiquitin-protein ligase
MNMQVDSCCSSTAPTCASLGLIALLRTPKARNCASQHKRRMDDGDDAVSQSKERDEEATCNLTRSLKRVRVSCTSSPGEICLERDLKYLVDAQGWRQMRDGSFAYESCILRHGVCPSELILFVSDVGAQVHLLVPRGFPHRPPKIMPIDYSPVVSGRTLYNTGNVYVRRRVETIVISDELQAGMWTFSDTDYAVVLANWTPIRRLGDCLIDIIRVLRSPPPRNATPVDSMMETPNHRMRGSTAECPSPTNFIWPSLSVVSEGDRASEPYAD